MAVATMRRATTLECQDRECHKRQRRDAATIWMLRRELEAARDSIEELEQEIERLALTEAATLE